ncbi:hypothetical protein [Natrialba aegyptia]|uniref:DUF5658 domain-containing protein n=1 Tax=Natrialba aegyptia DSM 13077 TaxID=1227491 RepID=M0AUJ0_9EURY|nr:hypothetical protein [Natrialba aegyptia]ELZ01019.1 hypothetical protein C480_18282 [Natrialba aegyptia DSM 13077]
MSSDLLDISAWERLAFTAALMDIYLLLEFWRMWRVGLGNIKISDFGIVVAILLLNGVAIHAYIHRNE